MNTYIRKQNFVWSKMVIKFVVLVILLLVLNIFQNQIRNSFYFVHASFSDAFSVAGKSSSNIFGSVFNYKNIQHENEDLRYENQKLLLQITALKESFNQIQDNRNVSTQTYNFNTVLGKIIGADMANDWVLIDKGSDDGVSENMPVISSQRILYGKVFKVYKNFSQIMVISNKDSVVDVKIQNANVEQGPILGAVKGSGGGSLYLDLVDSQAPLHAQDVLITLGLEGIYPVDMLVGKITSIDKNDLKPFQTAKVQPFFNFREVNNLFIITEYHFESAK